MYSVIHFPSANQQHQRHVGVGACRVRAPGVHAGPRDGDREPPAQLPGRLPEQLGPQTLHLCRAAHLLKQEEERERTKTDEEEEMEPNMADKGQPVTVIFHD